MLNGRLNRRLRARIEFQSESKGSTIVNNPRMFHGAIKQGLSAIQRGEDRSVFSLPTTILLRKLRAKLIECSRYSSRARAEIVGNDREDLR